MKKEKLTIVKIGSHIVDDDEKLNQVLQQFSALSGLRILVHGGGKSASDVLKRMGIEPKMVDGRRITDSETLKVVQMVYAGLINTSIVAKLNAQNCTAIGMTGADANTILAEKRPVKKIDYGFVGDIVKVNTLGIEMMLTQKIIPVFCALTHDGWGQILNTNADTIAAELGSALAKKYNIDLVFCFELPGVLKNPHDRESLISDIDEKIYFQLKKENILSGGIVPKIDNAFNALHKGISNVFIKKYNDLERKSGTRIHL
jgi:acetylglutamate kinase